MYASRGRVTTETRGRLSDDCVGEAPKAPRFASDPIRQNKLAYNAICINQIWARCPLATKTLQEPPTRTQIRTFVVGRHLFEDRGEGAGLRHGGGGSRGPCEAKTDELVHWR